MKKTEDLQTSNFIMKVSMPRELSNSRIGLMLHGWTGDESSMWVFANQFSADWLLISPRATHSSFSTNRGGYSWIDKSVDHWPEFQDFLPSVNDLQTDLIELSKTFSEIDFSRIAIFGFSQGAAAAFIYSMVHPEKVEKLGMLSGFIPDGSEGFIHPASQPALPIFIGHGSQDYIAPVAKAQEANKLFSQAGYSPHVCISEVGHRLDSTCFKAFSSFMNNR